LILKPEILVLRFYVETVGRNKKQIQEYIKNQLKEDYRGNQLTLFEEYDPLAGEKNKKK
jgi:putative transposase